MTATAPFSARPLDPQEPGSARQLALASGPHGLYVANYLARSAQGEDLDAAEVLACYGPEDLEAVCWFGARGNLIILQRRELNPIALARAIADSGWPWRIVLGPPPVVDALARELRVPPLVNRQQVYYGVRPYGFQPPELTQDMRMPDRSDLRALVKAALDLNHEDLGVDPARVDRSWVKQAVRERIKNRTTRVLGPRGDPVCKLDFGSDGAAGRMLEGVYTFAAARGRGHATALVAAVVSESRDTHPLVCLHVGAHNEPARRAYARAGMVPMGSCQLLLKA